MVNPGLLQSVSADRDIRSLKINLPREKSLSRLNFLERKDSLTAKVLAISDTVNLPSSSSLHCNTNSTAWSDMDSFFII